MGDEVKKVEKHWLFIICKEQQQIIAKYSSATIRKSGYPANFLPGRSLLILIFLPMPNLSRQELFLFITVLLRIRIL